MGQSLTKVLIHGIFSTKNRVPLIGADVEKDLHAYMAGIFRNLDCPALSINGTEDHIHALCQLSKNISVSELMKNVKQDSSKWIKGKGAKFSSFYWQSGYGAFSIGESGVNALKRYINAQKQHHKKLSFQDELRTIFRKYNVPFDERYVWD